MTTTKQEFVKSFLPESVKSINFAQIDLDISDLSLADVLRNANTTFPQNTRIRNAIASGTHAVGILCKTETLDPLAGILLIITGNDTDIEIVSKNYVVISIQEEAITDDDRINQAINSITKYIVTEFKDSIEKLEEFYVKYVYDEHEQEIDNAYDNDFF